MKSLSRVRFLATPWTAVYQAPLSMGFSRQEYWSGVPLPSPHYRGLECKTRKSRNTWSNRQIWSWGTEWSRAQANRVLPRERTGHSKYPLPTTQEKTLHMDINQMVNTEIRLIIFFAAKMEKLYTFSKNKTGSWLWLRSWTPYWDWNWRKWRKPLHHSGMT